MHENIWTPGDDGSGGPIFKHTVVPEGNDVSRERINLLAAEAWSLHMQDRERAARVVAWHTLPRGFKWAIDHPRILRLLKRVRIWNPPAMQWLPPHANCRSIFGPYTD